MKHIFYISISILCLQSCIKVETEAFDCTKPATPVLDPTQATISLGNSTTINVVNPETEYYYKYKWRGPNNYSATDANVQIYASTQSSAGTYKVVCYNEETGCTSDTAYFTLNVTQEIPSCGMGTNTFRITSNSNSLPMGYGSGQDLSDYYYVYSGTGLNSSLRFYIDQLPTTPGTYVYNITANGSSYLTSSQCYLYFDLGGNGYYSASGSVFLILDGTNSGRIKFCNATFKNSNGSLYTGSAADIYFSL